MSFQIKRDLTTAAGVLGLFCSTLHSRIWIHGWASVFILGLFAAMHLHDGGLGALLAPALDLHFPPFLMAALAFSVSGVLCAAVLLTQRFHSHLTHDSDLYSVQKLHASPVPRVGGIPILVSLFGALWVLLPSESLPLVLSAFLASMPIFLAGLSEDITKKVSSKQRLVWAMVSGMLACWLMGAKVTDLGGETVNTLLAIGPVAVGFSAFAMAGMANAINIIDGLNGLASGVVCLIAIALSVLAAMVGDPLLVGFSLALAFSVLGFWMFNFPFGKIFLGDGGAYLMGFLLGAFAILLKARNPEIDSWLILSILAYPVVEVLFSIYRRVRTKTSPDQPDFAHFHQLVQRSLVDLEIKHFGRADRHTYNSNVTPFLWCFCLVSLLLAFVGYSFNLGGAFGFLITTLIYILSYFWLARLVFDVEHRGEKSS